MDYKQSIARMGLFIENMPKSGIKFLYFGSRDLQTPLVRSVLSKWRVKNVWCYVAPGATANYCYVYRKSVVKYMVTIHADVADSSATSASVATISRYKSSRGASQVNHGDHVTFGVERGPGGAIIVKTHKTVYTENPPEPGAGLTFGRDSSAACNFLYAEVNAEDFGNTECYGKEVAMKKEYTRDPFSIDIVHGLYRAIGAAEAPAVGGGARRRRVRQRAGADPVAYKGVTFVSDTFVRFLSEKLFVPMRRLRDDLESAQVIFDEFNELGEGANRHVVVMYDFEDDGRSLFYVHTATALAAAYASENPTVANSYERRCLQGFDRAVAHPDTGIAAVARGGAARRRP